MVNKKEWETKSLEWIHKVREEIDEEIKEKGMTPGEWVKARGKIDVEQLCHKMGLTKVTIIKKEPFSRLKKAQTH
jgi:hypothetical protein